MTIEITSPEIEALFRERMEAGSFRTAEDLIRQVLETSGTDVRTGEALVNAMQACPFPEIEIEVPRVSSPIVRNVTLS